MKKPYLNLPNKFLAIAQVFFVLFITVPAIARGDDGKQIANVVQRGNFAYVYNAKGSQFLTLSAGDGIVGFTQSTVSIRRGNFIYVYNNKGSQTSVIPAGN